jgi:hypothetical protein
MGRISMNETDFAHKQLLSFRLDVMAGSPHVASETSTLAFGEISQQRICGVVRRHFGERLDAGGGRLML